MEATISFIRLKQVNRIVTNQKNHVITIQILTIKINQIIVWSVLRIKGWYVTIIKIIKTDQCRKINIIKKN